MDKCSESINKALANVLYQSALIPEFLPVESRHIAFCISSTGIKFANDNWYIVVICIFRNITKF